MGEKCVLKEWVVKMMKYIFNKSGYEENFLYLLKPPLTTKHKEEMIQSLANIINEISSMKKW